MSDVSRGSDITYVRNTMPNIAADNPRCWIRQYPHQLEGDDTYGYFDPVQIREET